MQTYEEAQQDQWNEMQDQARELVEQGDIVSSRRLFAESDKVYSALCQIPSNSTSRSV
jgi:hypothetical protein